MKTSQSAAITAYSDPMEKTVAAYMHLLISATGVSVKEAAYQAEKKYGISDLECQSMYREWFDD